MNSTTLVRHMSMGGIEGGGFAGVFPCVSCSPTSLSVILPETRISHICMRKVWIAFLRHAHLPNVQNMHQKRNREKIQGWEQWVAIEGISPQLGREGWPIVAHVGTKTTRSCNKPAVRWGDGTRFDSISRPEDPICPGWACCMESSNAGVLAIYRFVGHLVHAGSRRPKLHVLWPDCA